MDRASDIIRIISTRKAAGEPFALATVVRTVAATAAKAGAKAVILPDGTISEGWIGGGCARAAVLKAAKDALADGKSRLVSVQPPDLLDQQGHTSGEEEGGVRFANNMCPSQGTMDIFVEPVLPRAQVIICGSSPVAIAVADFAKRAGFAVTGCAPADEQAAFGDIDRRIEGYALPVDEPGSRYIVISTQGKGDEPALLAALAVDADYIAFVGSRKKAEALKSSLASRGISEERLAKLKAPAGLDLGAITPEEIAISILAEIVAVQRRKDGRTKPAGGVTS
jgi:xanthine dehydrogenase accessory factor